MNSFQRWWHDRGRHLFNIPLELVEKEDWRIKGNADSDVKEQVCRSLYRKEKCQHCAETRLKHLKTAETTYGRGSWWH